MWDTLYLCKWSEYCSLLVSLIITVVDMSFVPIVRLNYTSCMPRFCTCKHATISHNKRGRILSAVKITPNRTASLCSWPRWHVTTLACVPKGTSRFASLANTGILVLTWISLFNNCVSSEAVSLPRTSHLNGVYHYFMTGMWKLKFMTWSVYSEGQYKSLYVAVFSHE
jgi:hypothetical protein